MTLPLRCWLLTAIWIVATACGDLHEPEFLDGAIMQMVGSGDASGGRLWPDLGRETQPVDAGLPRSGCSTPCGTLWSGHVYYRKRCYDEIAACVDGHWEWWGNVCLADIASCSSATSGRRRCVVDDRGRLGIVAMGGSYVVANDGWTFSSQPNEVPMRGTLSAADQSRCEKTFEATGAERLGCGDAGTALSVGSAGVAVYALDGGETPILTKDAGNPGSFPWMASGPWIWRRRARAPEETTEVVEVIDLSGSTPSERTLSLPPNFREFSVDALGNWAVSAGALLHASRPAGGSVPMRSCGKVTHMVGAAAGQVAVATRAGQLLYLDPGSSSGRLQAVVPAQSMSFDLSSDGRSLALLDEGGSLKLLSLPGGAAVWTRSATTMDMRTHVQFSADDTRLVVGRQVIGADGVGSFFSPPDPFVHYAYDYVTYALPRMALSPDMTLVAAPEGSPTDWNGTKIYKNGALVGAAVGYGLGWIDDARLLVQVYRRGSLDSYGYASTTVCDTSGAVLATLPLPAIHRRFEVVSPTRIYVSDTNTIYSLTDGSPVWTRSQESDSQAWFGARGALAGSRVAYASGYQVFIEAY